MNFEWSRAYVYRSSQHIWGLSRTVKVGHTLWHYNILRLNKVGHTHIEEIDMSGCCLERRRSNTYNDTTISHTLPFLNRMRHTYMEAFDTSLGCSKLWRWDAHTNTRMSHIQLFLNKVACMHIKKVNMSESCLEV